MRRLALAAPAALVVAALSCSAPAPAEDDSGGLELVVSVREGLAVAPPGIPAPAVVWVHVSGTPARGPAVDRWVAAARAGGQFRVSLSRLPVGAYAVGGRAYGDAAAQPSAEPDYQTPADVAVTLGAREVKPVTLLLQQNVARWPPGRTENHAPTVDSVVASTQALDTSDPAARLRLAATASDLDGASDLAAYAWTAVDGGGAPVGAFSSPSALATDWTPPPSHDGDVRFTFTATDRLGAASSVSLTLSASPANARGELRVTVSLNAFPDVLALAASDAQVAPRETITFTATAADADRDPLRYTWSDDCGGALETPHGAAVTWRAPAYAAACRVSVLVEDLDPADPRLPRGGRVTASLVVTVRGPVVTFGPDFVSALQTPDNPVAPGAAACFEVTAVEVLEDPASPRPVTDLAWSDGRGGAFSPVGGDASRVCWTAPACAAVGPPFGVPVTVTATGSGTPPNVATFRFDVQLACP